MKKKILVPTDLGREVEQALDLSCEIARQIDGVVCLHNFISHPLGHVLIPTNDLDVQYWEERRYDLDYLQQNTAKLYEIGKCYSEKYGVTITTAIVDEQLSTGIDSYLKLNDIDLIVMGLSEDRYSEAQHEICNAIHACPIITVKTYRHLNNFDHILFVADTVHEQILIEGIEMLQYLFKGLNATIHLVHVTPDGSEKEHLRNFFEDLASTCNLRNFNIEILEGDHKRDILSQYSNDIDSFITVLMQNGQNAILHQDTISLSCELLKNTDRPILTINTYHITT